MNSAPVAMSVAFAVGATLAGCGDDRTSTAAVDSVDDVDDAQIPDPSTFVAEITNPFLPLRPGSRWVYRETSPAGEVSTITVEVLDERRMVAGIEAVVVHDVETDEAGVVVEDTFDWFAQDATGAVWYLGEATTAYDEGAASTEGSWEAGVDGARAGVAMPAHPAVDGRSYRQEYRKGVAEDMGQVIGVDAKVSVPAGNYQGGVRTRDWTPLEPNMVEEKTYAGGVGLVHAITTSGEDAGEEAVLIEFDAG